MTLPTTPAPARLPVAVLGAGPVGLAAAAHLQARGQEAVVLEAGPSVGSSVRAWGHVRLFTPWRHLVDPVERRLLERHGWRAPDPDAHPTGAELVHDLLDPLAGLPGIAPTLRLRHRVTAVARLGLDRVKTPGRGAAPFLVVADGPDGEVRLRSRAVIDATGTWNRPNPLGASGLPAPGERAHAHRIRYGAPDALGDERDRYAGRRTLVVGSGHSAMGAVADLAALAREAPGTEVVWAVRRSDANSLFGGEDGDELAERGALGRRARAVVVRGETEILTGFAVDRLEADRERSAVVAEDDRRIVVDEIVAATGFRPDLAPLRELRLDLDPIVEAPSRLAPLIDPNVHSCGTVPPHGADELAHPEPGFYVVGMKSYGRAPTFLLLTGYEQVRSVVAAIAGDEAAARRVELELPATGVCSTGTGAAACAPTSGPRAVASGCCG